MDRLRSASLVLAIAVLSAACGSRLDEGNRELAIDAAVGGRSEIVAQAIGDTSGGATAGTVGTTTGTVFGSADEGDSWMSIVEHLPRINSVEVQTLS